MIIRILEAAFLFSGLLGVLVEFVIRAQVNRHLAPDERIKIHDLQSPSAWLGHNGLIARHKKLYPGSWLANTFCALWVLFFATFIALIIYARTTVSR